jgi:hypothetical protein
MEPVFDGLVAQQHRVVQFSMAMIGDLSIAAQFSLATPQHGYSNRSTTNTKQFNTTNALNKAMKVVSVHEIAV